MIIPWNPRNIIRFILVDLCQLFWSEINLMRLMPLGLLEELPTEKQNWKDSNHGVREEERRHVPEPRQEDCVATDKGHYGSGGQGVVGRESWKPSRIVESFAVESLNFASLFPLEESECHHREID